MKNIILVAYSLLIVTNILLGVIISSYAPFNVWLVCVTILVNGLLSYAVHDIKIQDAYKISLSGICFFMMLVQMGLALSCADELEDNITLVFYLISFVVELIIGLVIYNVSKK